MNAPRRPVAVDFHVHTSYSFDCLTPPRLVVEAARRRGLDAIAVTDHDTVSGALATMDANRYTDLMVIPGVEVKSDAGDVIGLYVTQNVESRRFEDVLEEIHALGGAVYLPHALRTFGAERARDVHRDHPQVDLWERYNGRYSAEQHAAATALFDELGIAGALCGSDAHVPWEIGVFRTLLPELPWDAASLIELSRGAVADAPARGNVAPKIGITLGELTKSAKRRRYGELAAKLAALPRDAVAYALRQRRNREIGTPIVPPRRP